MPRTLVIIYGESSNDTGALRHLIRSIVPPDHDLTFKPMRSPVVLSRGAARKRRNTMSNDIARTERADRRRMRVVVVAHRDCDDVEPSHITNGQELVAELRQAGVQRPVAATPAWDIESWWMQFPAALAATRGCWRDVDYRGRHVGSIPRTKEKLTRDLKPQAAGHRCPEYRESDSIAIAREVEEQDLVSRPPNCRSDSFEKFKTDLLAEF